ncbi:calcium-translocating P-type ATPase, SERCA-type [Candidatus Bathyarchaeota archaeon]|nr:calcium-translocating P-type ATPase, SERCA-type [Candidatus Bathyarchaeota archaeon]MBS7630554.1 calcium-translocating P-type ATPase, SERCA-type [Candidatus Bathyarchaeota archaeon]
MSVEKVSWHAIPLKEIFEKLGTNENGLDEEKVRHRLDQYGLNEIREEKKESPLKMFLNQFTSILVIILIISAIVSAYISHLKGEPYTDTYVIIAIVIMNAILGFVQEYRAEKALEALKRMVAPQVIVFRRGVEQKIDSKNLVPGDIILLDAGTRVPADARLIEAASLRVDEAALTGESTPVSKQLGELPENTVVTDRKNMLFMGTIITEGRAKAVVTETGMRTEFGNIAGLVQEIEEEAPPMKQKMEKMGRQLGTISVILTIFVFLLGLLVHQTDFEDLFLTSVSLAVSAIPEGLPAVLTITLALGVSRMAKQKSIIRKLASVETLGSTTVICSDKTGTLTKNEMTVSKIYANRKEITVTGSGYMPEGVFLNQGMELNPIEDGQLKLLLSIGALCNDAHLHEENNNWSIFGDPTEGALLVVAAKAGLWSEDLLKEYPRIHEIPFDSSRKMMSSIHKTPEGDNVAYVKGAPEMVLTKCTKIYEDERVRPLNLEDEKLILSKTVEMAENALRVLALAYKKVSSNLTDYKVEEIESDLIFVGLVGMIDPPREEVSAAIKLCRQAGIRSVMVTGDHKTTAIAIAKQIGILHDETSASVLTGEDLAKMSDEYLDKVIDGVLVFARVSPEHKMRIAQSLKRRGHIVAMTGDGVNDAPALKVADIGVAMGIKGTDVTKEASDMILEDDNFATIVKAVEGGRHIYDNITKYVRLMLSANFDEFMEVTVAALMGIPIPYLPIHILWINLVTDGLPAVALSIDPKDPEIMKFPPRDPKEGLLNRFWRFIIFSSTVDFVSNFIPFVWVYLTTKDIALARSVSFTAIVFFEFILAYQCRSETHHIFALGWRGFSENKMLFLSVIVSIAMQFAIIYFEPLQEIFHVTALNPYLLLLTILGASTAFLIMPGKLIKRRKYASETLKIA